ncbi:MAG: hypothetical protein KOO63_03025 [Bacteroidales bacterium]|nr:hypothetical protein [Candidatus Latescibacterota bacterium]
MIHTVAERSADKMRSEYGWLVEESMALEMQTKSGEWLLTGTLDAYDSLRHILYDIKTLQEYAVKMTVLGKQNGVWSDHISDAYVKQLNLYRYLLDRCLGEQVERMVLQVIGFGQFLTTGHSDQIVALQKGFKFTREPYDLPDVPIVDDEMVEKWINREGDEWYRVLHKGEKAPVAPDDYKWLCKFCEFKGTEHCPDPDAERSGGKDD